MKVLMFSTSDGGISHYSHCLSNALERRGVEMTVLTPEAPPYDLRGLPREYALRTTLRHADGGVRKQAAIARNLGSFARAGWSHDLVHTQWTVSPTFDRWNWQLMRRMSKPIVHTMHDVVPHERRPDDIAHNIWLARHADAVIVHGEQLRETLVEMSDVDPSKVHVIAHGNFNFVADDIGSWSRGDARSSFGFAETDIVVLFFGYIRPYKGLDTLIDACGELRRRGAADRLRLMIAGRTLFGGGLGSEIHGKIVAADMSDRVTHTIEYVAMSDISRYFNASDIVVMPYKSASQSGVLQMAYAFSKPTVVTAVGSIQEVALDGVTSSIVPPDDPTSLATALEELIENPEHAGALGRAGRHHSETALGWEHIAARTAELYHSVL